MTARDRLIIVVVLVAAALAGVWFVGLAPKRKEAAELSSQIDAANQKLAEAQQKAATANQAKRRYNKDYAAIAKLGKAVPKSDALPSLIYQLQTAAKDSRIDFRSLQVSAAGGQGPAATPSTPANTAKAVNSANGNSSGGSSSSSSTPSSSAPATQAAAATLPPGATVGSAGFPTMPFSFVFNGSFFDMERFFGDVQRFVRVKGDHVDVRGRLLSIDGFSLVAGPDGFPSVKSSISATAYLAGADDTPTSAATSPSAGSDSSGGGSSAASSGGSTVSEVAR
ncbi:MAG TPA: type 4a pilus biogenesis protein PilO [Solirubrobacteraceae bacterium]|jgi:Tfp pilus assembly protein PilO